MALELTCLNISTSLPFIPINNNLTNIPSHSNGNLNGKAISQLISSSLARLTFSINDVRSFLEQVTSNDTETWDVSTIVKMKPVTSIIIYLSITLALFIALSLIFCIVSCTNCCQRESVAKHQRIKKRKCSGRCVCVVFLLLIGLIVIAQMIYIAYQVNRTKTFLDDSIRVINEEIYPKEISIYLQHLLEQFKQLDQYSTQTDSVLIKASQSLFVQAFDQIFRKTYFFDEIRQSTINSSAHITELYELIEQETSLPNEVLVLFQTIQDDNNRIFNDLEVPLQVMCNYANGTDGDINTAILESLDQVHEQLTKLIDAIQKDLLDQMPSGEDGMLLNKDLEDQIRWYIRLVGIILLVLVVIFGLIPIIFFSLIIIHRLCRRQQNDAASTYRYRRKRWTRRSQSSISSVQSSNNNGRSKKVLCCMRISFILIIIILIVMALVSGLLYAVDLLAQGTCRTVHDDRSFVVSFLIDKLLGTDSSDLIIAGSDVETTVTIIIEDCGNQIHFSKHFLENHLSRFDNDINNAMNELNGKIFDTFNNSIDDIDIKSDLDNLNQLSNAVNSTAIQSKIQQIKDDLTAIQIRFDMIADSVPALPTNLVNQTIGDFRSYLDTVLESTVDACPLPLATIYKADTLICHDFGVLVNGLWLSLFVYMFLITSGLCIGGLCIYKRSQSLYSSRSIVPVDQYKRFEF